MDNFDREQNAQNSEYTSDTNQEIVNAVPEEPQDTPAEAASEAESQPYVGNGAGRKESPFADSPYVMNHHQQTEDVPPQAPPVSKKTSKSGNKVGKRVLAAVLALSVVAGGCGITAAMDPYHNTFW